MASINFTETGFPLNPVTLADLETKIGATFPTSYRQFLLEHNGGNPEPCDFLVPNWRFHASLVNEFKGIDPSISRDDPYAALDLEQNIEMLENRLPKNFIPIGSDPGGNGILLSLHPSTYGKIYFWDHENEPEEGLENLADYPNIYWLADSFDAFLNNLKTEEDINPLLTTDTTQH